MIKFSSDSTCDLPKHFIEENSIAVLPLVVNLGEDEFYDGVNITPDDIFDYVAKTGELPKTAGRSVEDFKEHFLKLLENADVVVHCGIGADLSVCYQNACLAAKEIGEDKVKVIDSHALSTGTGLIVLSGVNAYRQGSNLDEVVKNMTDAAKHVQSSFMVDRLDFLHKGGRCSRFTFSMASLLRIKPRLEVIDGKLINTGKEVGPMRVVLKKYVDTILKKYNTPRRDYCLIAHTKMDENLLNEIVEYVKSKNIFEHVEECIAGSVITSHCGQGTLGILYINDGKY